MDTGELDKDAVSGVPFVGRQTGYATFYTLLIPENSDSENYEAAWKFIRWAASEEGQKIYMKTGCVEYLGVKSVCIPAGTKIAQMRIVEIPNTELVSGVIKKEENDDKENGDKKRGDNGFNSTGVK